MVYSNRGYVVHEGPSPYNDEPIVGIVTMRSMNEKTGDMAQLWILPRDTAPTEAVKNGGDASVCGYCPLRATKPDGKGRACYVSMLRGPLPVWKAYKAGAYADARLMGARQLSSITAGTYLRLGAWGDPAMLPYRVIASLVRQTTGYTGYTHMWPTIKPKWADFLMASVETEGDRRFAKNLGYRCFFVMPVGSDPAVVEGAMECAYTRQERRKLTCRECLACSGTRSGAVSTAVDVAIVAHGAGRNYL